MNMTRHTKLILGKARDGTDETSDNEQLAKKVYDTINNATTIHAVSIAKYGQLAMALIIWDD